MVKTATIGSSKTVAETVADLRQVFDDWGIDRSEWQALPMSPGTGYSVKYWLPFEKDFHLVSCFTQHSQAQNLRAVFMMVLDQQRAALRGVFARYGDIDYLKLLPGMVGDGPVPKDVRIPRQEKTGSFRTLAQACSFLGLAPDATREVTDMVARGMMAKYQPDSGREPNAEAFKKVNEARDFIYLRREWRDGQAQAPR